MSEIGVSEARTHLSRMLRCAEAGERFIITRHGHPVAELIPFRQRDVARVRSAIDSLKAFQETHSLGGGPVRRIVEEARRR